MEAAGGNTGYLKWNGEKQYFIRYGSGKDKMITVSILPYRLLLKDADKLKEKFLLIGIVAVLFAASLPFCPKGSAATFTG